MHREPLVRLGLLELLVRREPQDLLELLDPLDPLDLLELLELLDPLVLPELPELPALVGPLVRQVPLGLLA